MDTTYVWIGTCWSKGEAIVTVPIRDAPELPQDFDNFDGAVRYTGASGTSRRLHEFRMPARLEERFSRWLGRYLLSPA